MLLAYRHMVLAEVENATLENSLSWKNGNYDANLLRQYRFDHAVEITVEIRITLIHFVL